MLDTALWVVGIGLGLFALDRFFLWMESRGWIYYRRTKAGRGASTYHLFEWNAAFDPTMRQVQEESVREERQEDEAGDPPGREEDDTGPSVSGQGAAHRSPGNVTERVQDNLGSALRWIVGLFEETGSRYQAVGGLAVKAHGGTRPLADLDFYVPAESLSLLLPSLEPSISRPLTDHEGDGWRVRFLQVEYGGWRIEVGVAEGAQFLNRATGEWEDQGVDFGASEVRPVAGVLIPVMPLAQLMDYKGKLDREVDRWDVEEVSRMR
jgi:hypothetical protein